VKPVVSFQVQAYRKFEDPNDPQSVRGFAFCPVFSLPAGLSMKTNPRERNLKKPAAKGIRAGLLASGYEPGTFHVLNRGILISADAVSFDNQASTLTLEMPDPTKHGVVDGGHTYEVIHKVRSELEGVSDPEDKANLADLLSRQYVLLEIITGVGDDIDKVARARNTSVQVTEITIAHLQGKLQLIKDAIADQPYADKVAYKQFEMNEIDVQDIIAVLTLFLAREFPDGRNPVIAYSSKGMTVKFYLDHLEEYRAIADLVPKILYMHDYIKLRMEALHNDTGLQGQGSGKFRSLKEIRNLRSTQPLWFLSDKSGQAPEIDYEVPTGLLYPLLASLRYLVEFDEHKGVYAWKSDPKTFFDGTAGPQLVASAFELSRLVADGNPNKFGKEAYVWKALLGEVARAYHESHTKDA